MSSRKKHPEVLKAYKRSLIPKAAEAISNDGIEKKQTIIRRLDAYQSSPALDSIKAGNDEAGKYHNFILGALTQIFYPALTRPKKEQPVDDGRKRIDILFHNTASEGVFSRLVNLHRYFAPYVSVECKNYSGDPKNPEFDQLQGRLNRKHGFIGILVCRKIEDRASMIKRCQAIVNNNDKQLIMVLEDRDIIKLLEFVQSGDRPKISNYMEDIVKEILM